MNVMEKQKMMQVSENTFDQLILKSKLYDAAKEEFDRLMLYRDGLLEHIKEGSYQHAEMRTTKRYKSVKGATKLQKDERIFVHTKKTNVQQTEELHDEFNKVNMMLSVFSPYFTKPDQPNEDTTADSGEDKDTRERSGSDERRTEKRTR